MAGIALLLALSPGGFPVALLADLLSSSAQLGTALGLALSSPLVASAAPMTGYRRGSARPG